MDLPRGTKLTFSRLTNGVDFEHGPMTETS